MRAVGARALQGGKTFQRALQKLEINADWRMAGKLLSVRDVALITGYSYDTILEMRKRGQITPAVDQKPFRFSPEHIYLQFFDVDKTLITVKPSSNVLQVIRSLKSEKKDSIGHNSKPIQGKDLWQE